MRIVENCIFFLNTKKQEPRNETDVSKDGKEAKLEIMTEVPYPGLLNTQRYKSRREKKNVKRPESKANRLGETRSIPEFPKGILRRKYLPGKKQRKKNSFNVKCKSVLKVTTSRRCRMESRRISQTLPREIPVNWKRCCLSERVVAYIRLPYTKRPRPTFLQRLQTGSPTDGLNLQNYLDSSKKPKTKPSGGFE